MHLSDDYTDKAVYSDPYYSHRKRGINASTINYVANGELGIRSKGDKWTGPKRSEYGET